MEPVADVGLGGKGSGRARRRRWDAIRLSSLHILILPFVVILVSGYFAVAQQRHALAKWRLAGPACPMVSDRVAFPIQGETRHSFVYHDAKLAYRYGEVTCQDVSDGALLFNRTATECAFSSPGALAVTTDGRTYDFDPGIGRSALVRVEKGRLQCAVGPGISVLEPQKLD